MRYLIALLVLLPAFALADSYELRPSAVLTLTCSPTGGPAVDVPRGWYELHATGSATVCYAVACATGGMERAKGNHGRSLVPEGKASCRSDVGASVQLVPAVQR